MSYKENPKLQKSGVLGAIPQTGECPHGCDDCFFQSGRSFLEPLKENLPNLPTLNQVGHRVVRVNDGNDSSHCMDTVIAATDHYPNRFFNTANPNHLAEFPGPVVLTANPGKKTDKSAYLVENPPPNLMFVRVRTNAWNLDLVAQVVEHYTSRDVPVVLTFMAYFHEDIPEEYRDSYITRKRTLNSYTAITTAAWREIMHEFEDNILVSSCGKIEGEKGSTKCRFCGVCLREYFATMERLAADV
jgi:hypothetical protein